MANIAIVYWSSTGNTEAMANYIAAGVKEAGAEVDLFTASEFNNASLDQYNAIAFGCPAMGAENLEDSEFEPMWNRVKDSLSGKKVVLFGSYGWGDGEWMRTWESEAACPIAETYICNETPGEDEIAACKQLGANLTK